MSKKESNILKKTYPLQMNHHMKKPKRFEKRKKLEVKNHFYFDPKFIEMRKIREFEFFGWRIICKINIIEDYETNALQYK